MSVVILDGSTVRSFVADEAAFARSVDARFAALDANGDGVLSRAELRRALESFRLLDGEGFGSAEPLPLPTEVAALYDAVFQQFDADHSGAVDHAEFRDEMRRIMLAVAPRLPAAPGRRRRRGWQLLAGSRGARGRHDRRQGPRRKQEGGRQQVMAPTGRRRSRACFHVLECAYQEG